MPNAIWSPLPTSMKVAYGPAWLTKSSSCFNKLSVPKPVSRQLRHIFYINMATVYLNGEFMPDTEAKIPVLDRGFIFGDGVYEVIPVYGGNLFRLKEHLQRLQNSLDALKIRNPHLEKEWEQALNELIRQNGGGDLSLYLQITRGSAERDHAIPENPTPTVFAMCNPLKTISAETVENGVAAITLDDIRWQRCHIKAISLLPNV
ncbi:aminotransferase class IV, partial [Kaarinaea lacus]